MTELRVECPCGTLIIDRNGGPVKCYRCGTWHLANKPVPTGRPPILCVGPGEQVRMFCSCGVVLLVDPGEPRPRMCPVCRVGYRYRDQPAPPEPEPEPAPEPEPVAPHYIDNEEYDEAEGGPADSWDQPGPLPLAYLTDGVCMMCGHTIFRVRHHDPNADLGKYMHMRCSNCKTGTPARGETWPLFAFQGRQRVSYPDGLVPLADGQLREDDQLR